MSSTILNAIGLLIFLAYLIYAFRGKFNFSRLSQFLLWLGIFILIILAYAFRFELNNVKDRFISVLIPSYSWSNTQGQLIIARSGNGHFHINVQGANGQNIHFLIDTGASDVALTKEDAVKLGFKLDDLKYNSKYSTANGVSYAAMIVIPKLIVGQKTFYNVDAHVVSGNLDISLLGMSLINDFSNFKITKDMLILEY